MRDPRLILYLLDAVAIVACFGLVVSSVMDQGTPVKIGRRISLHVTPTLLRRVADVILGLVGIAAIAFHIRMIYNIGRKWSDDGKDDGDFPFWRRIKVRR